MIATERTSTRASPSAYRIALKLAIRAFCITMCSQAQWVIAAGHSSALTYSFRLTYHAVIFYTRFHEGMRMSNDTVESTKCESHDASFSRRLATWWNRGAELATTHSQEIPVTTQTGNREAA